MSDSEMLVLKGAVKKRISSKGGNGSLMIRAAEGRVAVEADFEYCNDAYFPTLKAGDDVELHMIVRRL